MSLLRQVDESRFLSILVRETHFSSGELLDEHARARALLPARAVFIRRKPVAVTSFPWELFGNRWGKFPRTGCPPPSPFSGSALFSLSVSLCNGNAISFSPAIFLPSDAERRANLRFPRELRATWEIDDDPPRNNAWRRSDAPSEIERFVRTQKWRR